MNTSRIEEMLSLGTFGFTCRIGKMRTKGGLIGAACNLPGMIWDMFRLA